MHSINRRQVVCLSAAALLLPKTALAHHGWSSFDDKTPIYLQGRASKVSWRNPHVEIMLALPKGLALPADLAQRSLPAQAAPVDGPDLLKRAKLPAKAHATWEVELAPLPRMQAWQIAEFPAGTEIAVIGYGLADPNAKPVLRAEYLWLAGKTYALRSAPA